MLLKWRYDRTRRSVKDNATVFQLVYHLINCTDCPPVWHEWVVFGKEADPLKRLQKETLCSSCPGNCVSNMLLTLVRLTCCFLVDAVIPDWFVFAGFYAKGNCLFKFWLCLRRLSISAACGSLRFFFCVATEIPLAHHHPFLCLPMAWWPFQLWWCRICSVTVLAELKHWTLSKAWGCRCVKTMLRCYCFIAMSDCHSFYECQQAEGLLIHVVLQCLQFFSYLIEKPLSISFSDLIPAFPVKYMFRARSFP